MVQFDGEIYEQQSWIDAMIGFGVVPERIDPMAQGFDLREMAGKLKNLTSAFDRAIASMPDHDDFLDALKKA